MYQIKFGRRLWILFIALFLFSGFASAQVDTTTAKKDTIVTQADTTIVKKDTIAPVSKDTPVTTQSSKAAKKGVFILYGGVTFNDLAVSADNFESSSKTGWQAGFNYRRGKFLYWQVGARYNSAKYSLRESVGSINNSFSINDLGFPLTAGVSIFSATDRVLNFRFFLSAIPAFVLSVSDNSKISKDDTNSFFWSGQAGLGVDLLFLVVEAGYNYGFSDVLKDVKSKPRQGFVTLGARF